MRTENPASPPAPRSVVHTFEGHLPETGAPIHIAIKQLGSGEWLIVMTNSGDGKAAINAYRKRWGIECLFGDAKTRGLNLEDTRLVNTEKLASLMGILTLAFGWTYRCATQLMGSRAIRRKAHGRREKSWVRTGLGALRTSMQGNGEIALRAWTKIKPKRRLKTSVVYCGCAALGQFNRAASRI